MKIVLFLLSTLYLRQSSVIPLNVTVRCKGKTAYISWVSSGNGGFDNTFQVMYKQEYEELFNIFEEEYIDVGQGKIHYATIDNLQSKAVYNFKVIAKNMHDPSGYTVIRNCATFDDDGSYTECNIASVAGGITSAFVTFIILMLTVIVSKQRRCTADKELISSTTEYV